MSKLSIIESATVLEESQHGEADPRAGHTVSLMKGLPYALDGVSPVVAVRVTDPEHDAAWLLRAAEQLLPLYRQAPGVVVLNESDAVLGIVPRAELEHAVMQMRRGDYAGLTRTLGLRGAYRPIGGDPELPFVYWGCPQCSYVCVPAPGQENDEPDLCQRHDPSVPMERRVHGGE